MDADLQSHYFEDTPYFPRQCQTTAATSNKCTIIGVGAVGMACAYSILTQGLCSEICLSDVDRKKLEGEVKDLIHAGAFLHARVIAASPTYEETANSDIIIITAGVRQREGETRLSLVERNVAVFKQIIPPVAKYSPNAILLVVSNPCDVLAWVAWKLSGFPTNRVLSSGTYLDTSRFRVLLAERLHINAQSVHGLIIGEHGDSSVPVWSGVNVAGVLVNSNDSIKPELDALHKKVKEAAYEVIALKGYTSWAIGCSVTVITRSILKNESRVLPLGINVKGLYGIEGDVFLSLPIVLGQRGIEKIVRLSLTEDEIVAFKRSAETVLKVQSSVAL